MFTKYAFAAIKSKFTGFSDFFFIKQYYTRALDKTRLVIQVQTLRPHLKNFHRNLIRTNNFTLLK